MYCAWRAVRLFWTTWKLRKWGTEKHNKQVKTVGEMWRQVATQEVTLAFYTAIHNHSLKSNNCTTAIIKGLFNQIFTCSWTKTKVIITKGMAPLANKQVLNGLQEASFQLWPILLINGSWSTLLLDIIILRKGWRWSPYVSLGRETTDLVSYYVLELFRKFELYDKVTEVSADNTNTNSGGKIWKRKTICTTNWMEK